MNWYIEALKKYAVFSGRARRKEYWFFVLFSVIITLALSFFDSLVGLFDVASGIGLLSGIYSLAVLIPSISVGVRRLHDTNRTGWWLLISLVPLLGIIILIVLMVLDSQSGDNEYGPNPKSS
jgi:uncharacterized membrane protein YhaH (DUF805 family)